MKSTLAQLREMTTVVADTGNVDAVKRYAPVDCTTNPSLILKTAQGPASKDIIQAEISEGRAKGLSAAQICATLTVAFGVSLSQLVPGRVSTEVDANLSFDTDASIARGRAIIADYETRGVDRSRILIKLAATWEGIRAAEALQKDGIDCNLTLVFSMVQAMASAQAGAFLISPFVGRITDWYKKAEGRDAYPVQEDPGVQSVQEIYSSFKGQGIKTVVMGASFRNIDQIKGLAGCDNLTIAPALLDELEKETSVLKRVLSPVAVATTPASPLTEADFRYQLNADPMATELLASGIRAFDSDHEKLVALLGGHD
jgi:transaldolase